MVLTTVRNYRMGDVASALQKAIRRGDATMAGYWAVELFESGYAEYVWRRLLVISAEDCAGVITHEVEALYRAWQVIAKHKRDKKAGRIFVSKATLLLALCRKSRDADHLTNLVYDTRLTDDAALEADLAAARADRVPVPEYAYDLHTALGKRRGKTKQQFITEEFDALSPREPGLFDDLVERVRDGSLRLKGE